MGNKKSKKSQITIFVIIAMIIVISIAVAFIVIKKPFSGISAMEDPQVYIAKCVSNSLSEAEETMLIGNGYVNVTDNFILFSLNKPKEKVPYLCQSSEFYKPCINQEPMFAGHVKKEIYDIIKPDVDKCFNDLINILKKASYEIEEANSSILEIEFNKYFIIANMKRNLVLKKGDETRVFTNFEAKINSPLYNLIDTSEKIVNYESTLCEFDTINWMNMNRDISIRKFVTGDQTKVYTIKDVDTSKQINIAVRTCVLPAGI